MSQVHPDDKEAAQDITKHPYFNTNSIWVRIDALKDKLAECDGVLPLPVIRNKKTVNPTDPDSEQVIQLENRHGCQQSVCSTVLSASKWIVCASFR